MASSETLACPDCGSQNSAPSTRCSQCRRYLGEPNPPVQTSMSSPDIEIVRWQRPVWLVFLLSLVTFDLYLPIWLASTWADIKREPSMRNEKLFPIWHGLTWFVPIYDLFRLNAHYKTIGDLLNREGDFRIFAKTAVSVIVAGFFVGTYYGASDALWIDFAIFFISGFLIAGAIAYGQWFLNHYFKIMAEKQVTPSFQPQVAPSRVFWWEWAILILGIVVTTLTLF